MGSFNSVRLGTDMIPILWVMKLRLRKVKGQPHGHAANIWQRFEPKSTMLESTLYQSVHKSYGVKIMSLQNWGPGASLVVRWLRIPLSTQGTWVQSVLWEDPTCRGATKPVHHDY